ncbi:MAG: transporter related protein [Ilumatobacteraceae bacterium]|nr:transporter related protein [Ilumatobacteraceae bacterium]
MSTAVNDVAGSAIQLDAVTKSFGTLPVVDPTSLFIEPGSFVSLLGPSGCGKSTLLRMVAGLETTSSGAVSIDGRSPDLARRDKRLAMVPQQPGLLPWRDVEANARLLLDVNPRNTPADHPDHLALLAEVGLDEFVSAYPHQLSGGMQQRVALVRGFALGAPLVLMDEPFAALDEITRSEMRQLLARLLQQHRATVLFVTHSITEAVQLSDRVLVFSPRPASIVADIEVAIARPRSNDLEDEPAFVALCASVRHRLHEAMGR